MFQNRRQVRGRVVCEARGDGDSAATMFGTLELRLDDVHCGGCARTSRSLGADSPAISLVTASDCHTPSSLKIARFVISFTYGS